MTSEGLEVLALISHGSVSDDLPLEEVIYTIEQAEESHRSEPGRDETVEGTATRGVFTAHSD